MLDLTQRYKRNPDVIIKNIGKSQIALNTETGSEYKLNEVSYDMLEQLSAEKTIDELINDEEFLDFAKQANIKIISFGIESSDEEILRFYKKKNDLEQVKRIVHYADSVGIFTVGNFIIGAPMETNETIENTFTFIRDCGFDQVHIKTLVYMQGSKIYDALPPNLKNSTFHFACKENGLNSFALDDLTVIKKNFLDAYYKERSIATKQKIEKYGIPFETS
jgi:radical SAM superfamily enzyme YgiQ (UPF0313 family)